MCRGALTAPRCLPGVWSMRLFWVLCVAVFGFLSAPVVAQDADAPVQMLLQEHAEIISDSSRRTIGPAIDALADSGLPEAQVVLERWQAREMWQNEETGLFVFAEEVDRDTLRLFDVATGAEIGEVADDIYDHLRPNSGIRGMIA